MATKEITVKGRKGNGKVLTISIDSCGSLADWQKERSERELVEMLNFASETWCRREASKLMKKYKVEDLAELALRFESGDLRSPGVLKKSAAELEIEKLDADPQYRMEFIHEMLKSDAVRHETLTAFQAAAEKE